MPVDLLADKPKDLLANEPALISSGSPKSFTPMDALAHPFTSALKTATGKSLSDYIDTSGLAMKNIQTNQKLYGTNSISNAKSIVENTLVDTGAQLGDMAMTPATYAAGPLLEGIGSLGSKIGGKLSGSAKRIIDSFKGASSADLQAKLAQMKLNIQVEKNNLDSLFNQKAKDITFKGKQVIPQISKGMSEAYGQGLEDIFSKLDDPLQAGSILKKNAPAITNTELVNNLESLVSRTASDPLIIKSDAYKKTVDMLNYFKDGLKSEAGLTDSAGNILKSQAGEAVDIKSLISRTREIRATIKASTQSGSAPVSAQDYFATQFDKSIGGLLKDRVEGFKELQASYAPMANTRKVAYKIFKPLSDEDSTLSFLQRIKNGNLKSSDEKLLKFLQDGGTVGDKKIPGMGNFSSDLKNIGNRVKYLNSGIEEKKIAAEIFKKASDEKFRNNFFLWTLGLTGAGTGVKKGVEHLIIKN